LPRTSFHESANIRGSVTPACQPAVVSAHEVNQNFDTGGSLAYHSPGESDMVTTRRRVACASVARVHRIETSRNDEAS